MPNIRNKSDIAALEKQFFHVCYQRLQEDMVYAPGIRAWLRIKWWKYFDPRRYVLFMQLTVNGEDSRQVYSLVRDEREVTHHLLLYGWQ